MSVSLIRGALNEASKSRLRLWTAGKGKQAQRRIKRDADRLRRNYQSGGEDASNSAFEVLSRRLQHTKNKFPRTFRKGASPRRGMPMSSGSAGIATARMTGTVAMPRK